MIKKNLNSKIQYIQVTFLIGILFIFTVIATYEINRMIHENAIELTRMYSKEILSEVNQQIDREIGLVLKMSNDARIVNWILNEDDSTLKEEAYLEIEGYRDILTDHNVFLAAKESQNYYLKEPGSSEIGLTPIGHLDENQAEDIWFFNTLSMDRKYDLNIDVDRFINTMRVWINVKVMDNSGNAIGVLGTGLHLEPFLNEIFTTREEKGTKSIIIDEFGAIQLDSNVYNIKENSYKSPNSVDKTIFALSDDPIYTEAVKGYLNISREPTLVEIDGDRYDIMVLAPIRNTRWNVVTFFNSRTLYGYSIYQKLLYTGFVLILIIILFTNVMIPKLIQTPIQRLNKKMASIKSHDDEWDVNEDELLEFGTLASEIGEMKNRLTSEFISLKRHLEERIQSLENVSVKAEKHENRHLRIMKHVPVGLFVLDKDRNFIFGNPALLDMFEIKNSEQFGILFKNSPESLFKKEGIFEELTKNLKNMDCIENVNVDLISLNGDPFKGVMTLYKVVETDGKIIFEGILRKTE